MAEVQLLSGTFAMTDPTDPIAAVAGLNPQSLLAATRISACMCTAVSLDIPDRLARQPMTAAALAEDCGAVAGPLERVLHALTVAGYLNLQDGGYALTALGETLLDKGDTSVHHWVKLFGDVSFFRSHAELLHTVNTGGSAYAHVTGQEMFLHFADNPEVGAVFDRAMTFETAVIAQAVIDAYDFSGVGTVADIGGSHGTLLAAVLNAHPEMRGILFDRSRVIPAAEAALEDAGLADRTECVAGSFFKSVPPSDIYLLKNIIHDWPDDRCQMILQCCREAMNPGGRILIVERVLEPDALQAICADLDMLVLGGGESARERTAEEYAALAEAAGCSLAGIIPIGSELEYSIIELVA
jgi:hypothetical protein